MRELSIDLKNHLAQKVTTLATCWHVRLPLHGTTFGFTDHSRDIEITTGPMMGTYSATSGYIPSAIETSSMLNVDNMDIHSVLSNVSEADLMAGTWDNAQVTIFLVNYENPSMGIMIQRSGTIGQITINKGTFSAEIRGLTQAFANNIGEVYSPMCRARFGDPRCKVNIDDWTVTGSVQAIDLTNRVISDSSRSEPGPTGGRAITDISRAKRAVVTCAAHDFITGAEVYIVGVAGMVQLGATDPSIGIHYTGSGATLNGYSYSITVIDPDHFSINVDTRLGSGDPTQGPDFSLQYSDYAGGGVVTPSGDSGHFDFGIITFTSGDNLGLSMEVKSYHPGMIELQLPMPYQLVIGDTYSMVAGCAKRFSEDCVGRFNNGVNFRGEPHLPGVDKIMSVGSAPDVATTTTTTTTP